MNHSAVALLRHLIDHSSRIEESCVHSEYEAHVDRHLMEGWRQSMVGVLETLFGTEAEHTRRFRMSCVDNTFGNLQAGKLIAQSALDDLEASF